MSFLSIFHLLNAILLVVLVLLQSQDSGFIRTFGAIQSGYHTKTGPEKIIYLITIISALIFVVTSILIIGR